MIQLLFLILLGCYSVVYAQAPGRQQAESLATQAASLENSGQLQAALDTTGEAINTALPIEANDILMRVEWQRGRLLHALGDPERALLARRRALYYLHIIRYDIPLQYHGGHSSYRETFLPMYTGFTDLLLQQASKLSADAAQPLLLEARDVLEQLKVAELRDYMGETCIIDVGAVTNLETIAPRTGVLYPILLPDRLELLLGIGNRQYQATVKITDKEIRTTAEDFSTEIRQRPMDGVPWGLTKRLANKLFSWLITPIQPHLDTNKISTLVIVPDGPLRLFPFSALMDSDTFLIERYAVVTAPSLTLMEPQPLARGKIQVLVAGMSEPGPVINELNAENKNIIIAANANTTRGLQAHRLRGSVLRNLAASIPPTTHRSKAMTPEERAQLVQSLSLPGVADEVKAISTALDSYVLLNQTFTRDNFSQEMQKPWRVVHIATHGFFGGTPDSSFFMTYDHLLKMNQLESLIEANETNPPELLILSACQTAEGNDRAPLGLTGVAIKSGARSALGSLWPVSDDATKMLISEFYRRLPDATQTKAQAFQQAQLIVLKHEELRHPFYWSPFILIGNWL